MFAGLTCTRVAENPRIRRVRRLVAMLILLAGTVTASHAETMSFAFRHGSLAHELGHMLRLQHPEKKKQQIFARLMGGRKPGYELTAREIARASKRARKLQSRALAAGSRR